MRKANKVLSIAILLSSIYAQSSNDRDFWVSLNQREKVILLQGIYAGLSEGLSVMEKAAARQQAKDPFWTSPFVLENSADALKEFFSEQIGYDYELISSLLDAFYSNPDNAYIDILSALRVLMLYQNGDRKRANEMLLMKQKEVLKGK